MKDYRAQLDPGKYYHVFNHAVSNRQLFLEDRNYNFFISKYLKYISPFVKTYSYCLLPNHFHFLILPHTKLYSGFPDLELSKRFKSFFNSYAQSFNKQYRQRGSLFEPRFKRRLLESRQDILNSVLYIHLNPVKHSFVKKPQEWKYSSYLDCVQSKNSFIDVSEVVEMFDDLDNFIFMHRKKLSDYL